ncbi:hypothetical protein [Pseudoalteromonas sp. SG44-8]|uniref:hypothetical protein n=1 Tax=Pseudoalteromonas sp. SG44-8 TaxID=2760958 RepID=UPI0016041E13|nr:hypothetical protein [Pseudoalteromonas sp. SG44-8]MBB1398090.1 hypothetical protein [Pseudoalteromonas sp. SG44-8]
MKLDPLIKTIICKRNIDRFTVVEVRTAYIALHQDQTLDPVRIRKLVYAQLNKLVCKGWLNSSTSQNRKITTYTKTNDFEPDKINVPQSPIFKDSRFKVDCNKELNECNNALLQCIGTLETYLHLWEKHPHHQNVFKRQYLIAQERQQNLKGRIAALNVLLNYITE